MPVSALNQRINAPALIPHACASSPTAGGDASRPPIIASARSSRGEAGACPPNSAQPHSACSHASTVWLSCASPRLDRARACTSRASSFPCGGNVTTTGAVTLGEVIGREKCTHV